MLNKDGSTLIESLFAFEIFVTVLIVFVSLFSSLFKQEKHIKENYMKILEREEGIELSESFIEIVEEVLH